MNNQPVTWKDYYVEEERVHTDSYNSIKAGALFVDTDTGNVYAVGKEDVLEWQKGFDGTPYTILPSVYEHILTTNLRGIATRRDYIGLGASDGDRVLYESLPRAHVRVTAEGDEDFVW